MLTRLMDLVVLVAELTHETNKNYNELDRELLLHGYSPEEIEQAVFWFSSRDEDGELAVAPNAGRRALRVLSDWERLSLSSECYGFLLRLYNLGIIDIELFEKILSRSIPVGPEKIELNEVKAIACSIIFNREPHELEEDLLDGFDEEFPTT